MLLKVVVLDIFISAGNISQQFFHAFNSFFRCGNSDLFAKTEHPSIESITQRNGDDDFRVGFIVVRDHHIIAKSVDDRIHDVIDEDKSDILHIAAVHGEGAAAVFIDIDKAHRILRRKEKR